MPSTKDKIVQLADEHIRKNGYNAFSYADIAKTLKIKNAAVHYHFPAKTDLAEAVIHWHIENFENFKERLQEKDELLQVKTFLNFYNSIQLSGKICAVGAFATDWNSMPASAQELVRKFSELIINWLTEVLEAGKEKNLLTFEAPARTEALKIITNMFAATQLARITNSDDFAEIKNAVIEELTK